MKKSLYIPACLIMAAFLGGQLEAQELIADVYSYNSANPNDSDGVYLIGTEVNIIVTARGNSADLQGVISITSSATRYSSVDRALDNMGAGAYRYVWRTTGLSPANDYKVSVKLRDADGNESINESTTIELYAPGLLLRSVDSQDAEKPEDDDELYHAGQEIRILVECLPDEQPSGTVQINSEITRYKSDTYKLQSALEKKLEYIWDTEGLSEADDYRVSVTLTDRAGHQITDDSLIITIDNTPPAILSVISRDRDDITDNDGIYHAGQTILIDVQAKGKEANLESEIVIKTDSVRYDSGPRRLTYQGEGLWRFIWTTTGLNAAKDYAAVVTIRDRAALESRDSSLRMEIDNTAPQNGKVLINNDEVYAISRPATLDISADGATKMYVSGDVADDVSTFEWIPYAKSLKVELSHGDAVKRISVRFMDDARNESPAVSDTIILDEQPPVIKSVGSYDEADKLDNDNIYHAGQSIIIVADTSEELVELEGTLTITSATARYDSGPQILENAGQGKYTYKWNTVGLLEAGDYVVSVNLKDPSDREVSDSNLRITIDNTPPSGGSVKINDGATETDSRSVTLSLSASGDPREVFIEGDLVEDTNTFKWIKYTSRIVANLTDTDGEKKVQTKFRDAARNVSGAVTATIILDRKAPTSTSIVIQDDARYTATRNVTLKLQAVNAEKMLIDGDVMDDNLTFDFINFREQVPVTLTPKDGEKHVGVIFKNAVGIQSDRIEDTIILDTTEPVILSVDSSDAEDPEDDDEIYHPGQSIVVKVTAGTGEAELDAVIRIRSQNAAYDTGEQEMERAGGETFTYVWNTSALQESDDYTVFTELTDAAGYKAGNSDLMITIDSLPPSRGQVVINDGEEATNSRTVRLEVSAVDAVSMFVSGDVSDDGNTFQWIDYRARLTVNLAGEDGGKSVYVKFKDAAGNESGNVTDSIKLDRESPYDLDIIIAATSEGASAGEADEFATSQEVFLAIRAKNAVEMYISGDLVDDDATFEWISYSSQMAVNLSKGDGEKTVSAKFRNQRGIESEQIEGRISLDTSSPEILSVEFQDAGDPEDDDGWYHPGESVRIIVEAREANEPETEITIKSESIGYELGPQKPSTRSFLSDDTWRFEYIWDTEDLDDGTDFAVEVKLTDAAGWVSTRDAEILILDSSPPTNVKMTINGGAKRTASRIARLEASAEDAVEMFVAGDLRSGDSNTFQWIPVVRRDSQSTKSVAVILTSGEGLKNIEVRFRDLAENETEPVIQTVILSQSPPVIEKVDSWDTSDTSDNDEKYHAGELIKLAVKVKSRDDAPMIETGLLGKVSVNDSPDKQALEESGGWYTYTWSTVGLAEGNYRIRWKLSDGVGHEAVDSSLNILIDNTPPRDPGIVINNGAEYTRSRSVNLSLKAIDASRVFIDGEVIKRAGATFEWIPFTEKITVSLAAGDGTKLVQARFKDDADNTTDVALSQIILDTIGPEVISVEIGDGKEYTASTEVKVNLKADDAAEMYIDGHVVAQSLARQWVPYQEEITLNLEEEDGEKTINVEFKDAVGNYSDKVSDTIILDTKPPEVGSVKSVNSEDPGDGDGRYMEGTQVEIEADAEEEGLEATIQIESPASGYASGAQKMAARSGGGIYTYLWDTNLLQAAEDYTAIVALKDKAGNSTVDESLIMAIFVEPLEQEVSINDGEEVTTAQSVQVRISADNAMEMRIDGDVVDDSATYEWIEFASSKEVKLTPGDGTKTVKVTFRDNLSREIGSSEATIKLDQTPPAIAEVTTAQKTYRAGETAEIVIQTKKREDGLEGTVQVGSFSASYDSGPQKITERGGGEYSYLWDTAGLKEGTDYLVQVILSDEAEWTVRDQSLIITIDNTPPEGGEITVNGEELFSQKRSVKLEFIPPDDAVDVFIEGNLVRDSNTFQWVDFSLFVQPLTINLSVGDGEKKVKVRFRDEAGNETEPIEKTVVLNELPPVIVAVDTYDEDEPEDNDEIYRSGRRIKLNITVEDREKMEQGSEEAGERGSGLEAWFRVESEETGYDSGFLTAVQEDDDRRPSIAQFSAVWNTSSAPEASDYVVEATLQDGFGQRSVDDSLTITVDNTPPAPPELSIQGDKKFSNSRNVTLTIETTEDDVVDMVVEGDVAESANTWNWVPLVDTKQIEFSDGDGTKVVTVKVRDSAGNVSEIASAEIALDRSVPGSLSISVNEGAEYTESHQVTLSLSATSAREMFISGSIVRDDSTFRWVPFQEIYSVRLMEGEGRKVIRAVFRNGVENESEEVEAEIVLDISPPTIASIEVFDFADNEDDDLIFHAGQMIVFRASAGKDETGLDGFLSVTDDENYETGGQAMTDAGGGLYTYLWNTEGLEDGNYLCEVTLEDIAGHSATDTVEIVIDNEGPDNPSIAVDAELTDSRTVEVALKADGVPAEVFIAGDVVNDDRTFEWIAFEDEMRVSVNLRGSDGEKKITAVFRDDARSESSEAEAVVTLEFKQPELAKSCRIIQTDDEPPLAYLVLQFDEPVEKVEPKDFLVVLRDKADPENFVQIDGTSTVPVLSKDTVMVEISAEQLDEIRQWQPMTFAYSYIQAEISENAVFDLADKGNLNNERTPADVYFALPDLSIQMGVEPSSFSPNADDVKDNLVIAYSPARQSDVTIRIVNLQKETVKEWEVEDQTGGLMYSVEWNGRKPDGSTYPDGEYTVIIMSSEVGAAGFAYGLKQNFTIDTSAPQIVDIRPWEGAEVPVLFRATVSVSDIPRTSGIESVYITVLGDVENKFLLAKSKAEGEYVLPATSELILPPGDQDVTFHVVDMAGNEAEKTFSYRVIEEVEARLNLMNFPNPFPPGDATNVRYSLPEDARNGEIAIYDAGGDLVFFKDLTPGELERGEHTFQWDGRDMFGNILARGIYFCRLHVDMETEDESKIHKIAVR